MDQSFRLDGLLILCRYLEGVAFGTFLDSFSSNFFASRHSFRLTNTDLQCLTDSLRNKKIGNTFVRCSLSTVTVSECCYFENSLSYFFEYYTTSRGLDLALATYPILLEIDPFERHVLREYLGCIITCI